MRYFRFIALQKKGGGRYALPHLAFTLPPEALLVAAAYGHLEQALVGADWTIVPLRSRKLYRGILLARI